MANDLTFHQLSTILNAIVGQATGSTAQAIVNTSDFVSVGTTALKSGYDPILNAISQVLSQTIFSIRPYTAKFKGLEADARRWGNMVRKLSAGDTEWGDDQRFEVADGESIDQQVVKSPVVLQENFYGSEVFERSITIFKDQLDNAFNGPDEFGRFISMIMSNASDQIEQARESVARMAIANFIGGKYVGDTSNVIHLLTEYNTLRGLSGGTELTKQTLYEPETFKAFMAWVYSRISSICAMMTERLTNYHINVTDKEIARHTPYDKQKIYLLAPYQYQTSSMVMTFAFHDDYLKYADHETVNFWQSPSAPDKIMVKPTYMDTTGALTTPGSGSTIENVFGVIFDEDAISTTMVNQWSAPAPFNARGGYTNMFWHFTMRYLNSFTENGVVLLLD